MHRQFTPSGIEGDVSRWLKELGYRGPGLRRETLAPLCRGESAEIWQTLMTCIRSESKAEEIRATVITNIRRQASKATHQRSLEEKTRLHELHQIVDGLTVKSKTQDNEVEFLESEVHRLQRALVKAEGQYSRHRELLASRYQQTKILKAGRSRLRETARSVGQDVESLENHLGSLKSILTNPGMLPEQGKSDLKRVLALMYELTQQSVSEGVRNRPPGEIFTPENLLPKLDTSGGNEQLFHAIGQVYLHHRKHLTPLFNALNEDAKINIRLYEMKYSNQDSSTKTEAPIKGIEELQVNYISNFVQQKQQEIESKKRLKSKKTSPVVQSPLDPESQLKLNLQQELYCLKSEVNLLEKEINHFRSSGPDTSITEVKELYKKLTSQIEHSKQMDVLLMFFIKEVKQMQKSFQKSSKEVKDKLQNQLIPVLLECCSEVSKCEGALSSEVRAFCPMNLNGRIKQLSLTEMTEGPPVEGQGPSILQRMDLAMKSANNQSYWINSFAQIFSEMKQLKPTFPLEGPESWMKHLSQGLDTAMTNSCIHDQIKKVGEEIEAETRTLCGEAKELIQKDEGRYQWVDQTVDQIDGNLKQGHDALQSLQGEVKTAFEDYRDHPAFVAIPWYRRNGKNAAEWVTEFKKEKSKL